jgi:hypothetical protein
MRRTPKDAPTKIGDLFAVYKNRLRAPQKSVTLAAQEVISDLLSVTLDITAFSYTPSTKTLVIRTNGMMKSEIALRKEEILAHLKGRLGEKSAPTTLL